MAPPRLGELELLVLLAILRLGDDAYAVTIQEAIRQRTGRRVSRATVYMTVTRMEGKGLVTTWLGVPLPERGGKARRFVAIEPTGRAAVHQSRTALERMWCGLGPARVSG